MLPLSPYNVISASAGSGKTYFLVQKILSLCLASPGAFDTIKNVLALTFTNKAANEMKERILLGLKSFTAQNYKDNLLLIDVQNTLKKQGIEITPEELHFRSQNVLDYVLHHYSSLNVGTIDKFNSRLIRSFSYELGLPQQFSLEIKNEPFLVEAIDRLLHKIGDDEKRSTVFMDLVLYHLEHEERVHVRQTLYERAKDYIQDRHYAELKKNISFDWDTYEKLKKKLRKDISDSKEKSKKVALHSLRLIEEKKLTSHDFYGKSRNSIAVFFSEYIKFLEGRRDFPFPSNEDKSLENFRKGSTSKVPGTKSAVEEILETLIENRQKIIKLHIKRTKTEKILQELLPFKFNQEIQSTLKQIENEQEVLLLSKFNALIYEHLRNEPSAFIYEKIGVRFHHFFIDEFQDTSTLQWKNFIPLKENSLSTEGNSFTLVGDPKQSIYRFRGGDSRIMLDIIHGREPSVLPPRIEILQNNWRSAKNIVDFNNALYPFLSENLKEEHRLLFSQQAYQKSIRKNMGRVKVHLSDYSRNQEDFFESASRQMLLDIQECLDNGHAFSDIAIICRTAKEIGAYMSLLGKNKVNYMGKRSYIKTVGEKGLTLDTSLTLKAVIEFLKWQEDPLDLSSVVRCLYYLQTLGRINTTDFTKEILEIIEYPKKEKITAHIEKKYALRLTPKNLPKLSLYNTLEYFSQEFSQGSKEIHFILNFLEIAYNFCLHTDPSLKKFLLYWDEEAHKISLKTSDTLDAIKFMTIHSAKGLEFPVVFLPQPNSVRNSKENCWYSLSEHESLQSIYISPFNTKLSPYDQDIQNFNEENTYQNTLDKLCILYVATTRPREQLFLYLQRPSTGSKGTGIYEFISSKYPRSGDESSFDLYPEHDFICKKSNPGNLLHTKTTLSIPPLRTPALLSPLIQIATPAKNYQNTNPKIRKGILTHEILAKLKTEKDLEPVLLSYLLEGSLTQKDKDEIKKNLLQVLRNKKYAPYFREGLEVISERDIFISDGISSTALRPDRIIQTQDGIMLIDFKTGTPRPSHKTQMNTYKNALKSMGKKILTCEIIYI
ncbi:MAG: DNA helicase UvrD [Bergeyella sp.]|nr:DNA helicase UvrD [Bergeyella sp.]